MQNTTESLMSLMIVVSLSFLVPIILYKFRIKMIPVVVAEIIVGLIIGKSGLNLVGEDKWLEYISLFGLIFLMFLSGLEIDFSAFSRKKSSSASQTNPLLTSSLIFLGILIISYLLSLSLVAMGLASRPFLMTLIISTVSLGIVVPVLKEKKWIETELGQAVLLVTVLADFFTMVMLAVYIGFESKNTSKMITLLLFFAVVSVSYFFIKRFASGKTFLGLAQSTSQIATRATFTLILLFVVLSDSMGADSILGAFLAGVIVALLSPKKEFVHQLDSFGYGFLIPIFFVMVGVKMEVWPLFTDFRLLLLIPLLLIYIFISKMIPALILKRWFSWRQVIGSGVILSTTLSLVIAASTIALNMGMISEQLHGALILVAVLSSLIFPVTFSRLFPEAESRKQVVSIVGANHISLPVARDLQKEGYIVHIYTSNLSGELQNASLDHEKGYTIHYVDRLQPDILQNEEAFNADAAVFVSIEDEVNVRLARHAVESGLKRIVVRVETPEMHEHLQTEGFTVFSTLFASRTLLKALIENPSAVRLITQDDSIREITVDNPRYHETLLRQLPFLGDVLILRIYRGESFIVPHGNTNIRMGDRLLVSGNPEHIAALKRTLE
ncbi:monovalent cation:proton antiporter family protein [Ferviditalea candida]|uniref:Monovalent cation:proton antiporter family protein n=1 Tax=Ferviditalea candida TaxID=3108399 RepID=A0ABU5ZJ18_9BACL|nr:monovalent cation:proton antiporter family protein [Paenibacillaceae bacterium T2]